MDQVRAVVPAAHPQFIQNVPGRIVIKKDPRRSMGSRLSPGTQSRPVGVKHAAVGNHHRGGDAVAGGIELLVVPVA